MTWLAIGFTIVIIIIIIIIIAIAIAIASAITLIKAAPTQGLLAILWDRFAGPCGPRRCFMFGVGA